LAPPAVRPDAATAFEAERRGLLLRWRLETLFWLILFSALLFVSLRASDFFAPASGGDPLARMGDFLNRMLPDLKAEALFENRATPGSFASWYYDVPLWLAAAWETVQMAVVGTAFGAAFALVLSFFASHRLTANPFVRHAVRRFLDVLRALPDLVLAIILAAAFGVGAVAGVLTIIISTTGSLGKLFSEANDNADLRQVEAMKATGAGWTAQMRYGVLPQVLPNHASYALLRLEGNLALAAALGIVGAGGIGIELQRAITYTEFDTYLAIFLMIVVMIFAIDMVSEAIRHRLAGLT
jgi:phosphonate transport system permease protein